MNHETLQALYALDVAEVGKEEAAKRWEYWAIGDKMWNTCTPNLMFIGQNHRRKPGIPWPKVVQDTAFKDYVHQRLDAMGVPHSIPESEHDKAGCRVGGRLDWVEEKLQPIPAWPDDAPEWANYIVTSQYGTKLAFECKPTVQESGKCWVAHKGTGSNILACPNWRDSLIERPKPVKQKDAHLALNSAKSAWPDDAPEGANYMTTDADGVVMFHSDKPNLLYAWWDRKYSVARNNNACPNWRDSLIERPPKPAVKKIDWSKLRAELYFHIKPMGELKLPSPWIAWNCDEHTRGNPLPDGLVVEWYGISTIILSSLNVTPPWSIVTRFRIVGIQEGWES